MSALPHAVKQHKHIAGGGKGANTPAAALPHASQRYAEPTVTTEEYEQGTYVYFDFNIVHDDLQTGWCYRRKENFTFR